MTLCSALESASMSGPRDQVPTQGATRPQRHLIAPDGSFILVSQGNTSDLLDKVCPDARTA